MQIIKQKMLEHKNNNQSWVATYECTATNLSSDELGYIPEDQILRLSFGFKAKDRVEAEQYTNNFAAAWFITREYVVSLKPLNNVVDAGTKLLEEKDEEKNLA